MQVAQCPCSFSKTIILKNINVKEDAPHLHVNNSMLKVLMYLSHYSNGCSNLKNITKQLFIYTCHMFHVESNMYVKDLQIKC